MFEQVGTLELIRNGGHYQRALLSLRIEKHDVDETVIGNGLQQVAAGYVEWIEINRDAGLTARLSKSGKAINFFKGDVGFIGCIAVVGVMKGWKKIKVSAPVDERVDMTPSPEMTKGLEMTF